MRFILLNIIYLVFIFYGFSGCINGEQKDLIDESNITDAAIISNLLNEYVAGWKSMDEERVLNLYEEKAMIQPNRLTPIQGKENIREFWFPDDGSTTIINEFNTEELSLKFRDTLAILTYESYLDWDYRKDTVEFGMIQTGIVTNIYRRQADNEWKVWRSMWSDISFLPK